MKVLHVLASNKFSGAENVVCQIINMFDGEQVMAYASPYGEIEQKLKEKNIQFYGMHKFCLKEIKRIVDEFQPDVIHAHDIKASILCSKIYKKAKIVATIHGNKKNMNKLSMKSLLFNIACKHISHIFWVSKSCYNSYYFKKSVQSKSTILANIISVDKLQTEANVAQINNKSDVLFLGRLVYEKNPLRIIDIANLLVQKKADIKISIVGDGEYKTQMQAKVNELAIQNNVTFWGFQSNPYGLLKNAKLLLLTSIMEGTPMCAVEAMALNVPVVSTKTDGMVELINGENGVLYDDDIEAVDNIIGILNDKNKLNILRECCKKFSEEYNDVASYKEAICGGYLN